MPTFAQIAPLLSVAVAAIFIGWALAPMRAALPSILQKVDSRGWFSIGLFALGGTIFAMLAWSPTLKDNQLFATLAQAIIITGLINMAAGFNFGAAKRDNAELPVVAVTPERPVVSDEQPEVPTPPLAPPAP
jgi:hypothetical protein